MKKIISLQKKNNPNDELDALFATLSKQAAGNQTPKVEKKVEVVKPTPIIEVIQPVKVEAKPAKVETNKKDAGTQTKNDEVKESKKPIEEKGTAPVIKEIKEIKERVLSDLSHALTLSPQEQSKTLLEIILTLKSEYFVIPFKWEFDIDKYIDETVKEPIYDAVKKVFLNHLIPLSEKEKIMIAVIEYLKPIKGHMNKKGVAKFSELLAFAGGMKEEISARALNLHLSITKTFGKGKKYDADVDKFGQYAAPEEKDEINHRTMKRMGETALKDAQNILLMQPKLHCKAMADLITNLKTKYFIFQYKWEHYIDQYIDTKIKSQLYDIADKIFINHLVALKDKEMLMQTIMQDLKPIDGTLSYWTKSPAIKFASLVARYARGMKEEVSNEAVELFLSLNKRFGYKDRYLDYAKTFLRYATSKQQQKIAKRLLDQGI